MAVLEYTYSGTLRSHNRDGESIFLVEGGSGDVRSVGMIRLPKHGRPWGIPACIWRTTPVISTQRSICRGFTDISQQAGIM